MICVPWKNHIWQSCICWCIQVAKDFLECQQISRWKWAVCQYLLLWKKGKNYNYQLLCLMYDTFYPVTAWSGGRAAGRVPWETHGYEEHSPGWRPCFRYHFSTAHEKLAQMNFFVLWGWDIGAYNILSSFRFQNLKFRYCRSTALWKVALYLFGIGRVLLLRFFYCPHSPNSSHPTKNWIKWPGGWGGWSWSAIVWRTKGTYWFSWVWYKCKNKQYFRIRIRIYQHLERSLWTLQNARMIFTLLAEIKGALQQTAEASYINKIWKKYKKLRRG